MSRSRFRSQPNLQRSRGGPPRWPLGLGVAAALGLSTAFAFRSPELPPPRSVENEFPVEALAPAAAPLDPAAAPMTETQPAQPAELPEAAPVPRQVAVANAPERKARRERAPVKTDAPPAQAVSVHERWEVEKRAYERARQAYDQAERAAGYRWAEQNRVRHTRYCRPLDQQRTSAFMEGCLDYLKVAQRKPARQQAERDVASVVAQLPMHD